MGRKIIRNILGPNLFSPSCGFRFFQLPHPLGFVISPPPVQLAYGRGLIPCGVVRVEQATTIAIRHITDRAEIRVNWHLLSPLRLRRPYRNWPSLPMKWTCVSASASFLYRASASCEEGVRCYSGDMPLYEYRCQEGHVTERIASIHDHQEAISCPYDLGIDPSIPNLAGEADGTENPCGKKAERIVSLPTIFSKDFRTAKWYERRKGAEPPIHGSASFPDQEAPTQNPISFSSPSPRKQA
jgi:hypothetical protein